VKNSVAIQPHFGNSYDSLLDYRLVARPRAARLSPVNEFMTESIWLWVGFDVFVLAMLALALGVFHRKAHLVSLKETLTWTGVWQTDPCSELGYGP